SVALSAAISAISLCGGASEGQRTLLDALYPALASLQESIASNKDNSEAFVASAEASLEGATKTKAMIAQVCTASLRVSVVSLFKCKSFHHRFASLMPFNE
ncbi:hypothetical protein FRX31_019203, partial [Thalictrum thalictroides]